MASATKQAAATPVGRVSPPVPAQRRIQVPQLAVGLLLSGCAALAFVLWNAASVQRTAVLALADDVVRGQILEAGDLEVVHVGTDDTVALTEAGRPGELIGRAAMIDLPAGTLVTASHLAEGSTLIPGAGVVGLALSPGQYPTPRLAVGDLVTVVQVADGHQLLVEAAEVVGVEPVGTQGQRFVSLLTGEQQAAAVSAAAAAGEVWLVQVARDRGGAPEGEGRP